MAKKKEFTIQGRVIQQQTGQGLDDLLVEAWDKDRRMDDALGTARTNRRGYFTIKFDSNAFRDHDNDDDPIDRMPDIYFRIYANNYIIKSTEDAVLYNVQDEILVHTIEVNYPRRDAPPPYVVSPDEKVAEAIDVHPTENPLANSTIGGMGLAVEVTGVDTFPNTNLVIPYTRKNTTGIEPNSVRLFKWDKESGSLKPVWNSGLTSELKYIWGTVHEPGIYVPLGLPRDRLLNESLRALAFARKVDGGRAENKDLLEQYLGPFLNLDSDKLDDVRKRLAEFEIRTGVDIPFEERNVGEGGHPLAFHLPGGEDIEAFRERIRGLDLLPTGFPEEELFRQPELSPPGGYPWPLDPNTARFEWLDRNIFEIDPDLVLVFPWFFSKDWPMYQHNVVHGGIASGGSSINKSTVSQLKQRFKVDLGGIVNTKPSIVKGKAYLGTMSSGADQGTMYKIDLCSGCIEGRYPTNDPGYYSISGIGGSPAIYESKLYFTTVGGKVYCLDPATMTDSAPHPAPLWVTDLKNPSASKRQPVRNPDGDCWSSPLVVNDRVYVGSGEGEVPTCWGFIWCLDANTGEVLWLFCTNKQQNLNSPGNHNLPNRIPRSAAVSDPLPAWATSAGFSIMNDPPETGSSPWSSFAYDSVHNQVYVGTGNSQYSDTAAPDQQYGSGLIALHAVTGEFRGFHTSQADDSYRPDDADIDVPGAPTVFSRGSQRVVCYGCKNGSFFLLDASDLSVLGGGNQRRQLLARANGTGHPGNRGTAISGVADQGFTKENKWGVMATPALHYGLGNIYIGLGGYSGAGDGTKTPFIRALDWNNLNDAWPTGAPGPDNVIRYTMATPPVYRREKEAALSSPAVVNDVVFVSTTDPLRDEMRLYALDAATGFCLWMAPIVSEGGWPKYALGPAISGEYVVAGAGNSLYIYTRPTTLWCLKPFPWWEYLEPRIRARWPVFDNISQFVDRNE